MFKLGLGFSRLKNPSLLRNTKSSDEKLVRINPSKPFASCFILLINLPYKPDLL